MEADGSSEGQVDVIVKHSRLAFIYSLFTPTIAINGQAHKRPWGASSFALPAGRYEVSVSYPWLLAPECGKNSVNFDLRSGEKKTVAYKAGLIRYLPGKISVS
jgi:hypothetical protein